MNSDQSLEFQQSFLKFKEFLDSNTLLFQKYRFLYNFQDNIKILDNIVTELTYCPTSYLENGEIDNYFIRETADYWFLMYSDNDYNNNDSENMPSMIDFQVLFYKDTNKVCFSNIVIDSINHHNSNSFSDVSYQKKIEFYVTNGAEYRYFSEKSTTYERPELAFSDFLLDYEQLAENERNNSQLFNCKLKILTKRKHF